MSRLNLKNVAAEPFSGLVAADGAIRTGPLEPGLRELIKIRVSQLNSCLYCIDQHIREARSLGEPENRIHHLTAWRDSALFSDKERAALCYAETATAPEQVTDELWSLLQKFFSDNELGHLVMLVALMNAFNRVGRPLQMKPPTTAP
ncbi:carboxymuconolactone decarboxylase family protein [Nocardia sp. CA-129566]|uniref:carboxymuconolactone decarboxylase family protein n=1 Tax=Nocardia sp. CA-129566 TaxID=3239976 RepID=UPI003D970260